MPSQRLVDPVSEPEMCYASFLTVIDHSCHEDPRLCMFPSVIFTSAMVLYWGQMIHLSLAQYSIMGYNTLIMELQGIHQLNMCKKFDSPRITTYFIVA
jgi:hypothetical protein